MTINELYDNILKLHNEFWKSTDFWIFVILAIIGFILTIITLFIAKGARKAAIDAKKSITTKNIELEMNDVQTTLKNIPRNINYTDAKQKIMSVNSTVNRILELLKVLKYIEKTDFEKLESSVKILNSSLLDVRPDNENDITNPYIISDGLEPVINDFIIILSTIIGKIQAKEIIK